ncbi:MAG: hypothetical protein ACOYNI_12310 [Acidimicrobiia bacterium]
MNELLRSQPPSVASTSFAYDMLQSLEPKVDRLERRPTAPWSRPNRVAQLGIEAVRAAHMGERSDLVARAHHLFDRVIDAAPDATAKALAGRASVFASSYPVFYVGLLAHTAQHLRDHKIPQWGLVADTLSEFIAKADQRFPSLALRATITTTLEDVLGAERMYRDPNAIRFLIESGRIALESDDEGWIEHTGIALERALTTSPEIFVDVINSLKDGYGQHHPDYFNALIQHSDRLLQQSAEAHARVRPTKWNQIVVSDESTHQARRDPRHHFSDLLDDHTERSRVEEALLIAAVGSFEHASQHFATEGASPEEQAELLARYIEHETALNHLDRVAQAHEFVGDFAAAAGAWEAWGDLLQSDDGPVARPGRTPRDAYERALQAIDRLPGDHLLRLTRVSIQERVATLPAAGPEPHPNFFNRCH